MSASENGDYDPADVAWREIERLIEEFRALAATAVPAATLYAALVERATRATGAVAAALWTRTADGRFQPEHHRHVERLGLADDPQARNLHARMLEESAGASSTLWMPAGVGVTSANTQLLNRGHTLSFTPLRVNNQTFAVLELAHVPFEDPELERGCQNVVDRFVQQVNAWKLASQLAEVERLETWAQEREAFALRLHGTLSWEFVQGEVVQGARRLLSADRVSLAIGRGKATRIEAVSGVEQLDRRTQVASALEQLAAAVSQTGEVLRWSGPREDLPPQIAAPLDAYLDIAHPRSIVVWPFAPPRFSDDQEPGKRQIDLADFLALLIVERWGGSMSDEEMSKLRAIVPHVAMALGNAWEYSSLPAVGLLRSLRSIAGTSSRGRRRRWLWLVAGLALVVTLLAPIEFTIPAKGELQPKVVRDVFAASDGEVSRLLVKHEQRVDAQQPLIELHSPDLQLERERVAGEYRTMRERLLAVESSRLLDKPRDRESTPSQQSSETELRQASESLESQLAIIEKQRESLRLLSPIAGEVLTWNPEEMLDSRPVKRGQLLLSVGAVDGEWEAKLDIADQRAGHVLRAFETSDGGLPVTFVLATSPGKRQSGVLRRIDRVTVMDRVGQPAVRIYVDLNRQEVSPLRPGASVVARVHCGRRPLGYVWFHELFEYLRTQFLF
jgi:multidrug efflux pump subunit AcrA (membrane-fusion protein)